MYGFCAPMSRACGSLQRSWQVCLSPSKCKHVRREQSHGVSATCYSHEFLTFVVQCAFLEASTSIVINLGAILGMGLGRRQPQ